MITKKLFGNLKGEDIFAYTISDSVGEVTILSYGGAIQSLIVPDREGKPTQVVLGYDNLEDYVNNGGYLCALIGRVANRIRDGKLVIDGVTCPLVRNDRGNHLHGGNVGFDKRIWNVQPVDDYSLELTLLSPDGEEGYPGNLNVRVIYSFKEGVLGIDYFAATDKTTAVNMTNHAYFNLDGGDILSTKLWLNASRFAPADKTMALKGWLRPCKDTPFDFSVPKTIGRDIQSDDEDIVTGGGYDHSFVIDGDGKYCLYAIAESDKSGIKMSCYTDMPAVQLYTGNGLDVIGRGGVNYVNHSAFCLETQCLPDNINIPEFAKYGSSLLKPDEEYHYTSTYKFEVIK